MNWRGFYYTHMWKETREAYKKSVGGLCERCRERGVVRAAEVVHHKIHLSPQNIQNPEITMGWDNLVALCRECHDEVHGKSGRRWAVGPDGTISPRSEKRIRSEI